MNDFIEDRSIDSLLYIDFNRPDLIAMYGAEECMVQTLENLAEDVSQVEGISRVLYDVVLKYHNNKPVALLHLAFTVAKWTSLTEQLIKELIVEGFTYHTEQQLFECRLYY